MKNEEILVCSVYCISLHFGFHSFSLLVNIHGWVVFSCNLRIHLLVGCFFFFPHNCSVILCKKKIMVYNFFFFSLDRVQFVCF